MASCAGVIPRSSATSVSGFDNLDTLGGDAFLDPAVIIQGGTAALREYRRYICRRGCRNTSGLKVVRPMPNSRQTGMRVSSTRLRWNRLYCGCSMLGGMRPNSRAVPKACITWAGFPFRGAPVEDLALVHQVGHGAHDFFNGGIGVVAVAEVEVNVIRAQALEGGVDGFGDVLARKSAPVGTLMVGQKTLLEITSSSRGMIGDGFTHHNLRLPVGVHVGVVEEVDALGKSFLDQGDGSGFVDLVAKGDPRAEGNFTYL